MITRNCSKNTNQRGPLVGNELSVKSDFIILGGGVAGLWLLNRLRQQGYSALLLEHDKLGSNQSIRSQGIIHGGIKYSLKGSLSKSTNNISDMPNLWQQCLQGTGEIDLSATKVLSEKYYLWSLGDLSSKVKNFLTSKLLHSQSNSIAFEQYPEIFKNPKFKGQLYQVAESVLDTPSLLQALAKPHADYIKKIPYNCPDLLSFDATGAIEHINLPNLKLTAQHYIFTAGEGNAKMFAGIENAPPMQVRPLHMVMAKFKQANFLYGHYIGSSSTPRITITTHTTQDGEYVWYMGGQLAEQGNDKTPEQQIKLAQAEIKQLLPWVNIEDAKWQTLRINRAEQWQKDSTRPQDVGLKHKNNYSLAWPTKLTLAPKLAESFISWIKQQNLIPEETNLNAIMDLPQPEIATTAWDELFND